MVKVDHTLFAHTPGRASVVYTPDAKYLLTVGSNNILRRYDVSATDEPLVIETSEENTGLAATNDVIVACSEDGTVNLFSTQSTQTEKLLVRTSLPTRDVALSPDGAWTAVASDEAVVKVVNVADNTRIFSLREQASSNKHVAFHPSGSYLAVSCTDGAIYVYSLASEEPELLKRVDGLIRPVEASSEVSAKVAWCPDGRAFAAPTVTRDIVVVSRSDWERQKVFANGHTADITDFAWSPNGAFLASAGMDGKIVIWESKTQTVLAKYNHTQVTALAWHPSANSLSFITNQGWLNFLSDIVPAEHADKLRLRTQPAPLLNDELAAPAGRVEVRPRPRAQRAASYDSVDDLFDVGLGDDDFLVDDDGAGYAEKNVNGKRRFEADQTESVSKRPAYGMWSPILHEPFQPCSTPWKGNRRYLCLNMVGFVWTVDQDTHNTVTTQFHDRGMYRDFHFTDPYRYDKACLNEHGTLFSSQPRGTSPAMLYYRPHETWAAARVEWRLTLPAGEEVVSTALSDSYAVVCTGAGYVRVYTLHGVAVRVHRSKHTPVVSCASFRDYVLTLANGPVGADGHTSLTYVLENIKRDEVLQSNDVVALPSGGSLRGLFFSDVGDPLIYDSDGVLLVLLHWREPGQARWVPLLDTRTLERLAGGGKEESYWPVAVANDKFHCIILKGSEEHPYFPRPMLSEFDFKIPLSSASALPSAIDGGDDEEATAAAAAAGAAPALEETFVRESVLLALQQDGTAARVTDADERMAMAKRENAIDKALLQLLILECKEEDHGEKALEICGLFRQRRTLDMAIKAAVKYEQAVLAEKIGELRDAMELEDV